MSRPGRPPKPSSLKLLDGSKKKISKREPKPPQTVPICPVWLSKDAKRAWRRMVPALRQMGVLTVIDGDALAAYCVSFARWREAEEFLDDHGMVYPLRDEKGNVRCMVQFPQIAIARNLVLIMRSFMQEFGMTPAARTRVDIVPFWGARDTSPAPKGTGTDDPATVTDRHGRPL